MYGDESQDSKKERVFAVGCLSGTANQWSLLCEKWNQRLAGKVFHVADCESGRGEFKSTSLEENHRLHRSLTQILANSRITGWGVAVDLAGRKQSFAETTADQELISIFPLVVRFMAEKAASQAPGETVTFTFDGHPTNEHLMKMLYSRVRTDAEWPGRTVLSEESLFASRREIGIQAADLWVRELMKRLDGHLHKVGYSPRLQWNVLESTKRFGADMQVAEYFADMKRKMPIMEKRVGVNAAEYRAWLKRKRRHDNQPNRLEYADFVLRMNR